MVMSWVLTILTLVMAGVLGMLLTMRRIQRAPTEAARDFASAAFWAQLGALGLLLLVAFARPIARFGWFESEAGLVTVALMSIINRPKAVQTYDARRWACGLVQTPQVIPIVQMPLAR